MRTSWPLRAPWGVRVVSTPTHWVQRPGKGEGGARGGQRECTPPLLYAAAAAGADGFFLETHPDPDRAPSDGANMIPLDQLAGIVNIALDVWHAARAGGTAAAGSQGGGRAVVEDRARAVPPARARK